MWLWQKKRVAEFMVWLGVDWPGMSDGEKLNAAIGVSVGVIGILLGVIGGLIAYLTYQLTIQTTNITTKQDRYFEEERAKRASFEIIPPNVFNTDRREFTLWMTNTGRRSSKGYWYLGVLKQVRSQVTVQPAEGFREVPVQINADITDNPFDDPGFSHFHDDYVLMKFEAVKEVGPLDRRLCATVVVNWQEGDGVLIRHGFLWFTQTPDVRLPKEGVRAMLFAHVDEYWIKRGTEDVRRKVQGYMDNPLDNSWLTF